MDEILEYLFQALTKGHGGQWSLFSFLPFIQLMVHWWFFLVFNLLPGMILGFIMFLLLLNFWDYRLSRSSRISFFSHILYYDLLLFEIMVPSLGNFLFLETLTTMEQEIWLVFPTLQILWCFIISLTVESGFWILINCISISWFTPFWLSQAEELSWNFHFSGSFNDREKLLFLFFHHELTLNFTFPCSSFRIVGLHTTVMPWNLMLAAVLRGQRKLQPFWTAKM